MQVYHANAKTNYHIRKMIKESKSVSSLELSKRYGVSIPTVEKWKSRENMSDKSSRSHKIYYSMDVMTEALALSIRRSSWLGLDDVWDILNNGDTRVSRSALYRLFKRNNINILPQKEKEKIQRFKEYEPGYLHIDITYLPKIEGEKSYLFVAIDRATRLMYYKIYDKKNSENAGQFFEECIAFFPFKISYILTDNGLEFSNKLYKSKKGKECGKLSLFDKKCETKGIKHRLTRPNTPKTNGMVERVNRVIKSATILKNEYKNRTEMEQELGKFMVYYNTQRRHGGLFRELKVKTPLQAVEKWYRIKPDIFLVSPMVIINFFDSFANIYK